MNKEKKKNSIRNSFLKTKLPILKNPSNTKSENSANSTLFLNKKDSKP